MTLEGQLPRTRVPKSFQDATSRTQQHMKNDVDINTLLRRYNAGHPFPMPDQQGLYGDFSNVTSFAQAAELVTRARDQFTRLPANIRKRFHQNPSELLDFAGNPNNLTEAIALGLVKPPEPPASPPAEDNPPEA